MNPLFSTLSLILSCIFCVTSESFNDVIFQLKDQNELPYLFEGIPVELRCIVDISKYSSVSWSKDGTEILTFRGEEIVSENLPTMVTANPVLSFSNRGFFSIVFSNLTIADHRGLYSCVASTGFEGKDSDSFLLDVKERKPVCASQKGQGREFLVGENLSLFCHNPVYNPPRVVRWYKMDEAGALQTMRTEYDFTSVDNATFALVPSMNGSRFACYATDVDESESTRSDLYSCSFGPISIFDSSYVTIDETSSGSNRTFSCRIVPQTSGAMIRWTNLPAIESFDISTSDYQSSLTIVDVTNSYDYGSYISLACEVSTPNGKNFSVSKSFLVTYSTETGSTPDRRGDEFPILLLVIAVGVAVVFIFVIAIILLICCAINSARRRSKPRKSAPTGSVKSNRYAISLRKNSSKTKELVRLPDGRLQLRPCISIPEDDIELEETEKSPLSSGGVDDSNYDLPPYSKNEDVPPVSPIYANKEHV